MIKESWPFIWPLAILIVPLLGYQLYLSFWQDVPLEESVKSTTLPITSNRWKEIELENQYNSNTYVLELKHGWLVYRSSGFGGGMTFVPKPD